MNGELRTALGLPVQSASQTQRSRWQWRVRVNRVLQAAVGLLSLLSMADLYWTRGVDFLLFFPLLPVFSAFIISIPYAAVGYLRRCSLMVTFQVGLVCLVVAIMGAMQELTMASLTLALVLAGLSWLSLRGIPILCAVPRG